MNLCAEAHEMTCYERLVLNRLYPFHLNFNYTDRHGFNFFFVFCTCLFVKVTSKISAAGPD